MQLQVLEQEVSLQTPWSRLSCSVYNVLTSIQALKEVCTQGQARTSQLKRTTDKTSRVSLQASTYIKVGWIAPLGESSLSEL